MYENMTLYHGGSEAVTAPDPKKSHSAQSFGRAFYAATRRHVAAGYAVSRSAQRGGEATVTEYLLSGLDGLRVLEVELEAPHEKERREELLRLLFYQSDGPTRSGEELTRGCDLIIAKHLNPDNQEWLFLNERAASRLRFERARRVTALDRAVVLMAAALNRINYLPPVRAARRRLHGMTQG